MGPMSGTIGITRFSGAPISWGVCEAPLFIGKQSNGATTEDIALCIPNYFCGIRNQLSCWCFDLLAHHQPLDDGPTVLCH